MTANYRLNFMPKVYILYFSKHLLLSVIELSNQSTIEGLFHICFVFLTNSKWLDSSMFQFIYNFLFTLCVIKKVGATIKTVPQVTSFVRFKHCCKMSGAIIKYSN